MPEPGTTPPPALDFRDVAISYHGRRVLEEVSLQVPAGGITAFVGASGCGKSSLLLAINRLTDLVAGCRVDGEITVGTTPVAGAGVDLGRLRRRVATIFQRPTVFPMSIGENVALALREHGVSDAGERAALVERGLRDVGLWDEVHGRLDRPARELSGGQQQRLCLARALVLEPEVLLLDEPCSALDPIAGGVIEELLLRLRQRHTIVLVTHNLAQARRVADHAALFWATDGVGRLVESDGAEQLFSAPRHALTRLYLSAG